MRRDVAATRGSTRASGARNLSIGIVVAFLVAAVFAGSAAGEVSRAYTGTSFGPDGTTGTASFGGVRGITVDESNGFIYAYDSGEGGKIFKFDLTGEPVPFESQVGNVIENVGGTSGPEDQIAVAPAGSPGGTAGDIYLATNTIVKVFSKAGTELGTLGEGETCGVAVSTTGHLFIASYSETIKEYVPANTPPTDADLSANGTAAVGVCNIALDGTGAIYAANYAGSEIAKLKGISDTGPSAIEPGASTLVVDPESNDLYADRGESVAIYDPSGSLLGRFGNDGISGSYGVAVSEAAQRAYVSDGGGKIRIYGPVIDVPRSTTGAASDVIPNGATLSGSVSPEGSPLQECFFEYGETTFEKKADCTAPDASEVSPTGENVAVHARIGGLKSNTSYRFRLVTGNSEGSSTGEAATFTTPTTVITEGASVSAAGATVHGKVFPSGAPVSACKFEYGRKDKPGFEGSVECDPPASGIESDSQFHPVSAEITGLEKEKNYRYRLVATTVDGTTAGETFSFETFGRPLVRAPRAGDADQGSVTLEDTVNPRGSATSYRFDWGPTASYGQVAPVSSVTPYGSGGSVVVKARVTGLTPATSYHFHLVATNADGTVESTDAEFETLDSCELPDRRCFELVSERDSGPVAVPSEFAGTIEVHFQAGAQPGADVYVAEEGFPDATKGSEVVYRSLRGPAGWTSTQISAPLLVQNQVLGGSAHSSQYQALSETLSCGVLGSNQPLTDDPSTRLVVEAGGINLYRDNMNGTYTAISAIPPENPSAVADVIGAYNVDGISSNCGKVVFQTTYKYPGVPTPSAYPLYEWDEGTLRSVGSVPGPGGGEVQVNARPAVEGTSNVSADGSRVYFTANREASANPEELNKEALFVRENGQVTRDVSLSETSTPDRGATFQMASKDGSRVFFLANAGLTSESSSEGTDLYEYDFASEGLTDLSVDEDAGGAEVAGMIGASDDGSTVYFLAQGELVSGQGESFAENVHDKTYSVYREVAGKPTFVGSIQTGYPRISSQGNLGEENYVHRVVIDDSQTSQVSADGRFLLFESSLPLTGYESGNGISEAYLYDAASAGEPVVCVTCRPDGQPSAQPRGNRFLNESRDGNSLEPPRSMAVRDGKPQIFFTAFDALAPGSVEGLANLYEWSHGQVFRIDTEAPGFRSTEPPYEGFFGHSAKTEGMSADGTDLYFAETQRLNWEDQDDRFSIYDARVDGGYPQPPPSPGPCDPSAESSCQGAAAGTGASVASPPTRSFNGPGNPKPKKHHKKKHHKRHRKHRSGKKHGHGGGHKRDHRHAGSKGRQGA